MAPDEPSEPAVLPPAALAVVHPAVFPPLPRPRPAELVSHKAAIDAVPATTSAVKSDPKPDIAPVAPVANAPYVILVTNSLPATTVPEFIAYAKANPGKINFASGGIGTVSRNGLRRDGDAYVNEAYGKTHATIQLNVQGGVGEISLVQE